MNDQRLHPPGADCAGTSPDAAGAFSPTAGHIEGCPLASIPVAFASCPCGLDPHGHIIAAVLAHVQSDGMLKVDVEGARKALAAVLARATLARPPD